MKRKPQLFNAENTYRLIWEMIKSLDMDMPFGLIPKNTRLILEKLDHVDICVVRNARKEDPANDPQIPYLMIMTRPSNTIRGPQKLITLRFRQTDIRQTIHEHTTVGTMEVPTDYSMLNALKLAMDLQKAAEAYIYEELGVTGFHELWAPIQQRHSGETKRIDKVRDQVKQLIMKAV